MIRTALICAAALGLNACAAQTSQSVDRGQLGPRISLMALGGAGPIRLIRSDYAGPLREGCPGDAGVTQSKAIDAFPVRLVLNADDPSGVEALKLTFSNAKILGADGGRVTQNSNGGEIFWDFSDEPSLLSRTVRIDLDALRQDNPNIRADAAARLSALSQNSRGETSQAPAQSGATIEVSTKWDLCLIDG